MLSNMSNYPLKPVNYYQLSSKISRSRAILKKIVILVILLIIFARGRKAHDIIDAPANLTVSSLEKHVQIPMNLQSNLDNQNLSKPVDGLNSFKNLTSQTAIVATNVTILDNDELNQAINSTGPIDIKDENRRDKHAWHKLVNYFTYLISIIANVAILCSLSRKKNRLVMDFFIIFCAGTNLLGCFANGPLVISTIKYEDSWVFGEFICQISNFARSFAFNANIVILLAISYLRYMLIVKYKKPIRGPFITKSYKLCVISGLIISIILGLFKSTTSRIITPFSKNLIFCISTISTGGDSEFEFGTLVNWCLNGLIQLLLSVIISVYYHVRVYKTLKSHERMQQARIEAGFLPFNNGQSQSNANGLTDRKKVFGIITEVLISYALIKPLAYVAWFYMLTNSTHDRNTIGFIKMICDVLNNLSYCYVPITLEIWAK